MKLGIFTHASRFLSSPLKQRKITHSIPGSFSQNSKPPGEREGRNLCNLFLSLKLKVGVTELTRMRFWDALTDLNCDRNLYIRIERSRKNSELKSAISVIQFYFVCITTLVQKRIYISDLTSSSNSNFMKFPVIIFGTISFNAGDKNTPSTFYIYRSGIYLLKVNNRNTRTRCEISSKLTIKTPEQHQWRRSSVFIVTFKHISHLVLVFLLLILYM